MSTPTTLHLAGPAELGDVEAFLERVARLDPGTLVRLRAGQRDGYLAAHARLPVDVLVGRSVRGALDGDADVTATAGDLLGALRAVDATSQPPGAPAAGSPTSAQTVTTATTATAATATAAMAAATPMAWRLAPSLRRDAQWRGTLPPGSGWEPLDSVPVGVIRQVVTSAAQAFRVAVPSRSSLRDGRTVADSLLDQEVLTVSGANREVVLPLRVLQALRLMGFLGTDDHVGCGVAVRGRWVRVAAPYGTAYRESGPASIASI